MGTQLEIIQLHINKGYSNFNYILYCPVTLEALLIDPIYEDLIKEKVRSLGLKVSYVFFTHGHSDHISGRKWLRESFDAKWIGHPRLELPLDYLLKDGEILNFGNQFSLKFLHTPGHTKDHICLFLDKEEPVLFSGDTLFHSGVGHCLLGGNPEDLFKTIEEIILTLPEETKIYPGHHYFLNNLEFTLSLDKDNHFAQAWKDKVTQGWGSDGNIYTSLKEEKKYNLFLRYKDSKLVESLETIFSSSINTPQEVFFALRERRNQW